MPGKTSPGFLIPAAGGCDSWESCKTAKGYESPTITYQNSIYALREIVIHTPSEHTVDGMKAAAEIQLVSELVDCVKCVCQGWGSAGYRGAQWCCCEPNNAAKPVLIQSLLLQRGEASKGPSWIPALASVAKSATGEPLELLPDLFFRDITTSIHTVMSTYFLYDGSLSRPPCSAHAQWLIIKRQFEISDADLKVLSDLTVGGNSRPVQPLYSRTLAVAGTVQF